MDKDYLCGDWGDVTDWTQLRVTVALADLDELTAIMSMVSNNLQIEDYSDIDLKTCYGDLIDESILNADKTVASVSVYLPAERNVAETVAFLRDRFDACGLEPKKIETVGVREEDWANSWKQYYKPIHVGREVVVVPEWEPYQPAAGEIVITMDPGMAFGTGTHETTRLVMRLLEKLMPRDPAGIAAGVLDVGTGSGILSICAAKLNPAAVCEAYDIDPMAVRVAKENIEKNGLSDRITCRRGGSAARGSGASPAHHLRQSGGGYHHPDDPVPLPLYRSGHRSACLRNHHRAPRGRDGLLCGTRLRGL